MTKLIIPIGIIIFILFMFSGTRANADSLGLTLGVGSKHNLPYELNEENGGIGIWYMYNHSDALSSQVDYLTFENSYHGINEQDGTTTFTGYTLNYTPYSYKKAKIGVFVSVVYNDGYCGFFGQCREGQDNTGLLPMVGIVGVLDNLIGKITALPNVDEKKFDAYLYIVQMKALEW